MASCSGSDRRCAACGADLHGKVAYPVLAGEITLLSCEAVRCISRVFNDNVDCLTPEERQQVTRHIQNLRCQAVRNQACERARVSCYT